jgi:hypothetical protein
MDAGVPFGRWRLRLEFSLAIFKLKRFDCADKLGADREKTYKQCIRQLAIGGALSDPEQRVMLELGNAASP